MYLEVIEEILRNVTLLCETKTLDSFVKNIV